MTFFAMVFFWLAYIILKYQLHYVYATKFESGGQWFPKVFFLLCLSMVGFQITTFAAVVIIAAFQSSDGTGKKESAAIIVLAILTGLYYLYITNFVAPKASYVPRSEDREIGLVQAVEEAGEDRVYNPAMVKPLTKIWVRPNQQDALDQIYRPEYSDLLEYTKKNARLSYARVRSETHGAITRARITSSGYTLDVEDGPPELRSID
jgi:Calcium-dependent channel, 7TM region, putative phosphate